MNDQFDFKKVPIPRVPMGILRWVVPAILILIFVVSTFYTVGPEEIGVVLRLGRYTRSTDPGLHFKIPLGIERVTKVPIQANFLPINCPKDPITLSRVFLPMDISIVSKGIAQMNRKRSQGMRNAPPPF